MPWQEESQAHSTWYWVQIVRHWIKTRLAQHDVALSTKLRYLISQFMFTRVKNEFQALFEIMVAESTNQSTEQDLSLKFKLHCLRKRIEDAIVERYEVLNMRPQSTTEGKRVNIL